MTFLFSPFAGSSRTRSLLTPVRCRYFSQRYSIFSWYDYGIYMTDDAWFGVTPEPVAKYVSPYDLSFLCLS